MQTNDTYIPKHVAIVMDGNGRWAEQQDCQRSAGHSAGVKSVEATIRASIKHGVQTLSLFAFSVENWGRPQQEVSFLLDLLSQGINDNLQRLNSEGVRIVVIGDLSPLPTDLLQRLNEACELTRANSRLNLVVAINYSGRWDIVQAASALQQSSTLQITEQEFAKHLSAAEFGDIDLFIRTSGEMRLSNFMLWQLAYSELYFAKCYWPDFSEAEFAMALEHYSKCERRFGLLSSQMQEDG